MRLNDFLELRGAERDWARANGFSNPDPASAGWIGLMRLVAHQVDLFVDVGAGQGGLTRLAVRHLPEARVHAFEPNATLVPSLRRAAPSAQVHALALSDEDGETILTLPERVASGEAGPGTASPRPRLRPVRVGRRRLDALALARGGMGAAWLCIETGAHEEAIVRGGESLVSGHSGALVSLTRDTSEAPAGEPVSQVLEGLRRRGHEVYRLTPLGLEYVPAGVADIDRLPRCTYVSERGLGLRFRSDVIDLPTAWGQSFLVPFGPQ